MTIDEFMAGVAPMMRKGWVAMDGSGQWYFFKTEPVPREKYEWWIGDYASDCSSLDMFDITPVDDWKKSKRKVGK